MKPPTHSCGHVSQRWAGTRGWRPPVPPWLWGASTLRTHHSVGTPPCSHTPPILAPLPPPPPARATPKSLRDTPVPPKAQNRWWHRDVTNGTLVPTPVWGWLCPCCPQTTIPGRERSWGGSEVAAPCRGQFWDPPQLGQDPPPVPGGMPGVQLGTLGSPDAPGVSRFPLSSTLPFYHRAPPLFLADQN